MIAPFEHQRAGSIDDALRALAEGVVPYAGGTELLAAMKLGLLAPERIIDLKRIPDLNGVTEAGDAIYIGATTPHAAVAVDPHVNARLPMLAAVTRDIGNPRVRWQGTVGGNLCFAEPRSDLVPALIALDATLRLRTLGGERSVAVADFIIGAFTVDRRDDELLIDITIPTIELRFQRYDRIQLQERPTAGVALVRRGQAWRLCVGAAGYVPVTREVPSLGELNAATISADLEAIDDAAGSADYKRHLVRVLVDRVVAAAKEAAE